MESTPQNLPDRLRAFHALAKDRPALAVAAPIMEAAEEIDRLRELAGESEHIRRVLSAAQMVVAIWENEPAQLDAEMRKFQLVLDRKA